MHLNLHKTFATPHGGGGPGAGPVGVAEKLVPFLPISLVVKRDDGTYALEYDRPKSIGYIAPFYGNFGIILRAYAYMLMLGGEGLLRRRARTRCSTPTTSARSCESHYEPAVDRHLHARVRVLRRRGRRPTACTPWTSPRR